MKVTTSALSAVAIYIVGRLVSIVYIELTVYAIK